MSTGAVASAQTDDDGIGQALARARQDGMDAGRAEASGKITEAYMQGRTDAAAIMQHEAAGGRTKAAAVFASNSKFSKDEAVALLGVMAKEDDGAGFQASLKKNDPQVPANGAAPADAQASGTDFQTMVAGHVHRMIQGTTARKE